MGTFEKTNLNQKILCKCTFKSHSANKTAMYKRISKALTKIKGE
jgi:hypothetical protein